MHIANKRKKNYKNKKSRYNDQFLVTAVLTPPKQHQKFSFSKSDASRKKAVHKHHHHPIIRFSPWRNSSLAKIMPSTR
jgi:hypothetical protein